MTLERIEKAGQVEPDATLDAQDQTDIVRIKSGDTEAFTNIWERHFPKILKRVSFALRNHDPENLASDILEKAYSGIIDGRYKPRPGVTFSSWLNRVATNAIYSFSRSPSLKHTSIEFQASVGIVPTSPHNTESEAETNIQVQNVLAALGKISPRFRQTMLMRAEGMSYQEIGKVMNTNTQHVRLMRHRGITSLKRALREESDHDSTKKPRERLTKMSLLKFLLESEYRRIGRNEIALAFDVKEDFVGILINELRSLGVPIQISFKHGYQIPPDERTAYQRILTRATTKEE